MEGPSGGARQGGGDRDSDDLKQMHCAYVYNDFRALYRHLGADYFSISLC